jgi:hypothetical protein
LGGQGEVGQAVGDGVNVAKADKAGGEGRERHCDRSGGRTAVGQVVGLGVDLVDKAMVGSWESRRGG